MFGLFFTAPWGYSLARPCRDRSRGGCKGVGGLAKKRHKGKQPSVDFSAPPKAAPAGGQTPGTLEGWRGQLRRLSAKGGGASGAAKLPAGSRADRPAPVRPGNSGDRQSARANDPGSDRTNLPASGDRKVWDYVARQVVPLPGREFLHHDKVQGRLVAPAWPAENPAAVKSGRLDHQTRRDRRLSDRSLPSPDAPPPPAPCLAHGQVAALDRRKAERLKRGRLGIDDRIDLHGMTQADAHLALNAFIARSHAKGLRCLLVVTGKGLGQQQGGVLKRQAPSWLNQAPNRSKILAFDFAQPRDGGTGALYVLLKRQRP